MENIAGDRCLRVAPARILRWLCHPQFDNGALLAVRSRSIGELDKRGEGQRRGRRGVWVHLGATVPAAWFHQRLHGTAVRTTRTNPLQSCCKALLVIVVFSRQGDNRQGGDPLPIVKGTLLYTQPNRMSTNSERYNRPIATPKSTTVRMRS